MTRQTCPDTTDWNSRHDWKAWCHAEDAAALHQQLQPNTDAAAVASEASGVLGTSFYISPEIANGWPQYDNKVDLYSLGVIAFELWHPFTTAMERVVLRELVETGVMPPGWPEVHPVVRAICAANTHSILQEPRELADSGRLDSAPVGVKDHGVCLISAGQGCNQYTAKQTDLAMRNWYEANVTSYNCIQN